MVYRYLNLVIELFALYIDIKILPAFRSKKQSDISDKLPLWLLGNVKQINFDLRRQLSIPEDLFIFALEIVWLGLFCLNIMYPPFVLRQRLFYFIPLIIFQVFLLFQELV